MRITVFAVLAVSLATSCGNEGPVDGIASPAPAGARTLPPITFDPASEIAWQARLPCADCAGLETSLRLARDEAGEGRYELQETYMAADGGERFVETGRWRIEGRLLRLEADGGGARAFALEPDGRLSPRDARGRRTEGGDMRFLDPLHAPAR